MRLVDLGAVFYQHAPLGVGIFTGLLYHCPNDPLRKRRHLVLFDPVINPYTNADHVALAKYLAPHTQGPKWARTGETIDTLTLRPSIAYPCCHLSIVDGNVIP